MNEFALHRGVPHRARQLAALLLMLLLAGSGASYPVRSFDVPDGLPSATVYGVAQDASGRLWIHTRSGLAVYDGTEMRRIPRIAGHDTSRTRVLVGHDSGRVWIFMPGWSGYNDGAQWHPLPAAPQLPELVNSSVLGAADAAGDTVVLTGGSNALFVLDGDDWSTHTGWLPSGARVTGLTPGRDGRIVIVTTTGLCALRSDGPDCGMLPIADGYVRAARATPDGVWVLSDRWLRRYRGVPDQPQVVVEQEIPDFRPVNDRDRASLLVDHDGLVLAGSMTGFFLFDPQTRKPCCESLNAYVNAGVHGLFEDREHQLWASTTGGLFRIGSRRFRIFDRRSGLLEDEVSALAVRGDGSLVVGHNDGFSILADGTVASVHELPVPENAARYRQRVMEILMHDGGTWFAASAFGFGVLRRDGSFERVPLPPGTLAYALARDGRGGLWLQAAEQLYERAADGRISLRSVNAPDGTFFRRVALQRGELYQVSRYAVFRHRPDGSVETIPAADGDEFWAIQTFEDRILLGASRGLLALTDEGGLVPYAPFDVAVPEMPVFSIVPFDGGLVLGTNDGLLRISPAGLVHRSVQHGLPGRETNRGALVADGEELWVGTERGLARYRPRLERPPVAPRVELTVTEAEGHEYAVNEPLTLGHDESHVEFRFRVVTLAGLEGVQIRTRLIGWEDAWSGPRPLDASRIRYVNLPAGRYVFSIAATRDGISWSAPATSAPITVTSPLLDRPEVKLTVALLLAGALATLLVVQRRRERLAGVDALTGLPNRRHFLGRLRRAIRRNRDDGAVVFMDLNDFKTINDSFGHETGDQVLVRLARRLRGEVAGDGLIARFGGDEFTLLLVGRPASDLLAPGGLLERLAAVCSEPVEIGDARVQLSACFGVREFRAGDGSRPQVLIRDADTAMYRAKALGRGEAVVYSESMRIEAKQRLELENAIRRGIDDLEFDCDFQPIVDLSSGRIVGLEALARWRQHGVTRHPAEFLDAARQSGLVRDVSLRVLDRALQAVRHWEFITREDFYVSVNASAIEIRDSRFATDVEQALARYGVAPSRLAIELTEEALIDRDRGALDQLWQLRALGVTFFVDDFGTGYSSFGYLDDLPVSALKIDRSFIEEVASSERRQKIVTAMISLARNLQLNVVAEGIETDAQHRFLRDAGCRFGQGYLFGAPAPRAATLDRIKRQGEAPDAHTAESSPP